MRILLVGGAVRDRLLQFPVYDRDWVVIGSSAQEMLDRGYRPVGKDFPVFLHPQTHEEYALARTERKVGRGYKGFTYSANPEVTLEQDLQRRDLTINAMAEDENGQIIDPYGGRRDLNRRLLRHVSPAFAEDPLRVLRVARFIARYQHLGFRVADETLALMRTIVQRGEIQDLTPERVWQEIERALMERSPSRFFDLLHQCGALGVLMPELEQRYHSGCQGNALDALDRCSQSQAQAPVRFAVLSYFFNSPAASDTIDPSTKDPSERCERLKAPGAFKEAAQLLNRYADTALKLQQLDANKRLELFEELDLLRRPKRQSPFLQGCRALAGHSDPEAPFPAEHILNRVRLAVESVTPQQLVNEGYKGKALGLELRERRLKAVQEFSGPS